MSVYACACIRRREPVLVGFTGSGFGLAVENASGAEEVEDCGGDGLGVLLLRTVATPEVRDKVRVSVAVRVRGKGQG